MNRGGQGRDRTGDLPLFRRTLVPTELPGRTAPEPNAYRIVLPILGIGNTLATLTGLEPATSAVTGRRANQLRHRALLVLLCFTSVKRYCVSLLLPSNHTACSTPVKRTPYGIRTRATALKGRRPRPLDEGGPPDFSEPVPQRRSVGSLDSLGHGSRISQIARSDYESGSSEPESGHPSLANFSHHSGEAIASRITSSDSANRSPRSPSSAVMSDMYR